MVGITISLDDKTYKLLSQDVENEIAENMSQAARKLIKCGYAWRLQLEAQEKKA